MINLTRPWWSRDSVTIGDPFLGAGTTLLEGLKNNASVVGGDECPILESLVADNLTFFSATPETLKLLLEALEEAEKIHPSERLVTDISPLKGKKRTPATNNYFWALEVFEKSCVDAHGFDIALTPTIAGEINSASFDQRVFFYLALRTHRRNLPSLQRDAVDWWEAYKSQSGELRNQIDRLIRLRERQTRGRRVNGTNIVVFPGWYSVSCAVEPSNFCSETPRRTIMTADARKFPESLCDVVVTDPPYGFNTKVDPEDLANLYNDMISVILRSLKHDGQITLALPDWSHIGRQVPFFVTKRIITRQILAAAQKLGREVIQQADTLPPPSAYLRPPYYWESERALRRAILHFRIVGSTEPKPQLSTEVKGCAIS